MRNLSNGMSKFLILFAVTALTALLCAPLASAAPILGPDLASFTVLGATTVTNVPTSVIVGNVGVSPGTAITGFEDATQVTGGTLQAGTALAQSAQAQLTTAITYLGLLGPGTLLPADLTGLTILPGVYTVQAGATNLSGAVTLNGLGNANALWVFQMPSSLITSPDSVVNVINTGAGAGVFWNVGSSATIDVNTTFMGNILALTDISMNTSATDLCGRALANNGQVSLQMNTLNGICSQFGGLSGSGLDYDTINHVVIDKTTGGVVSVPGPAPVPVPEPSTMIFLGSGLAGLAALRKRVKKA